MTPTRARGWILAAVIGIGAAGSACGSTPGPTAPAPPAAVTVTSVTVTSPGTSTATFQLTATARMSDGSSLDVTQTATWVSSNIQFATVSATGLVTVQASGETDLRATYLTVSGSTHAVVVRIQVVALTITGTSDSDAQFQLTATARLSDGTSANVTNVAAWDSSDSGTATVSAGGLVRVVSDGEADIRATHQGMTDTWHLSRRSAPTFGLVGFIVGTDQDPIAGASVRIVESSVPGNPVLSDARGMFTFTTLAIGRHLIEVSKTGYELLETEIVIVDRDLQIGITLK